MKRQLSFEDVARYPRPGMAVPHAITFTPDSLKVAYLFSTSGTLVQDLWSYDLHRGTRLQITAVPDQTPASSTVLSFEEELLRERRRIRDLGVTEFQFARSEAGGMRSLLVRLDGRILLAQDDGPLGRLHGAEGALDARLSPDGSLVAFVRLGNLYIVPTDGRMPPRQLTGDAGAGVTNGLAEYIAEEEMGRHAGYWWSPDGAHLAYVRADSSHIPRYPIVHQGTDVIAVEEHHYPFAGGPNARVRLGVVAVAGPEETVQWMDLGTEDDIYLARVAWRPDGTLTAVIQSRDQQTIRLLAFDIRTGSSTTLIEEHGRPWLSLSDDLRFLSSGEFLWSSEKTGFRHLYLHHPDGRERRALTEGSWMVTGRVTVDEEQRLVYFEGTADGVLERHLYAVSLDGGPTRRLTREAGWHETVISPNRRLFVDTWSSLEQPPRVSVRRLADDVEEAVLFESTDVSAPALGLCVPELVSFPTQDGILLHGAVYAMDSTREEGRPRPLIVATYGGPSAQTVTGNWTLTVDLRAQYLAQQGYVVLKVDNRGSANRGIAFGAAIAGTFGQIEVDDQVEGVRFLAHRPYVDATRVAIYGWSYGGYMACRALLRAPDVFKAGVAGAPVTAWEGYDSHYTERYLGSPSANAAAYQASAVLPHVQALRGALLLVHGLVDENVHVRHTVRLIAALMEAAKTYELVLLPEERHMVRTPTALAYLERRVLEFLQRQLDETGT